MYLGYWFCFCVGEYREDFLKDVGWNMEDMINSELGGNVLGKWEYKVFVNMNIKVDFEEGEEMGL